MDPALYINHSLRAGGASDYLAWGVPQWVVQHMGHWKQAGSMTVYQKLSTKDIIGLIFKSVQ